VGSFYVRVLPQGLGLGCALLLRTCVAPNEFPRRTWTPLITWACLRARGTAPPWAPFSSAIGGRSSAGWLYADGGSRGLGCGACVCVWRADDMRWTIYTGVDRPRERGGSKARGSLRVRQEPVRLRQQGEVLMPCTRLDSTLLPHSPAYTRGPCATGVSRAGAETVVSRRR